MIRVGIICKDITQVEEITNLIYNYTHMPPYHRMRGLTEWIFPLLSIEIMLASHSRGQRFDIAFYDEQLDEDIVNNIIWPCCNVLGCRPQPLKTFLWRFHSWRNTTTDA